MSLPVTKVPYNSGYAILATSPRTERFSVSLKKDVNIRNISLANHTTLTGASNTPANYLFEGSVVQLGNDGNYYWYGVTLPGGVTAVYQTGVSGSNGALDLAILVDSYDTNYNGTGNPVNAQAYFSGAFMLDWLLCGGASPVSPYTLTENLRTCDILIEGGSTVTTQTYGPVYPRESAPV